MQLSFVKTKTIATSPANHNRGTRRNEQSILKATARNRREARENAPMQVAIGFGFASHWLRKWCEFCWPITKRSNAKPKQKQFTFDA